MWSIGNLKNRGKEAFKRNYWKCVLVGLLVALLGGGAGSAGGAGGGSIGGITGEKAAEDSIESFSVNGFDVDLPTNNMSAAEVGAVVAGVILVVIFALAIVIVISVFVLNPLEMGTYRFFFINQKKNADVKEVCFGYDRNYMNNVKTLFFRDLYIFLWSLLLIIPGIVKSYEYRMIPYILADDPQISMEEAFARSKYMMQGETWHAFCLDLSFIGWWLLSIITCGIVAIFYAMPYELSTNAALYEALKYLKLENHDPTPAPEPQTIPGQEM